MSAAAARSRVVVASNPRVRNSSIAASRIRRRVAFFLSAVIRIDWPAAIYYDHAHIMPWDSVSVKRQNERAHNKNARLPLKGFWKLIIPGGQSQRRPSQ